MVWYTRSGISQFLFYIAIRCKLRGNDEHPVVGLKAFRPRRLLFTVTTLGWPADTIEELFVENILQVWRELIS